MKKCMALILTLLLAFGLCGCGISTGNHGGQNNSDSAESGTNKQEEKTKAADSGLKVGFLFPSDSNATDTISRLACIDRMQNETGLTDGQILVTESVKESNCEKEVAAMVDKGAKLIFCKAKGYEDIIIECARTYPDVQFIPHIIQSNIALKGGCPVSAFPNNDGSLNLEVVTKLKI